MKKFLALLAAALLLSTSALAAEYQPYINDSDGYQVSLPADWAIIDQKNVDELIASMTDGSLSIEGMDASVLQQYKAQMEAMDMMVCMGAAGNNLNIVYQALPMTLDNDALIASVLPTTIEQLKSMFADYQLLAGPMVYPVGDREFVAMVATYSVNGLTMISNQAYYLDGAKLYNFTITIPGAQSQEKLAELDQMIDEILASFVPASEANAPADGAASAA